MVFFIKQERDKCIGCGACVGVCPANWEMRDDGKSAPKKTKVEEVGCNKDAEENCPVKCIHVTEK